MTDKQLKADLQKIKDLELCTIMAEVEKSARKIQDNIFKKYKLKKEV